MEAILVALITGGLSLLGVVITNMMAARRAEQRMVTAQAVTDARAGRAAACGEPPPEQPGKVAYPRRPGHKLKEKHKKA